MVQTMEKEMASILDSASLFEVNVPDYKQLKQCRKELCMLKLLWDYVSIVTTSIEDWKTTPWLEINVEQMDMDCKKFAKDIRTLDKEMRAWDTYTGVESTVKNMLTSLRAVSELQNSAIRDRHWAQLMQATGVSSFTSHINMMILIIVLITIIIITIMIIMIIIIVIIIIIIIIIMIIIIVMIIIMIKNNSNDDNLY